MPQPGVDVPECEGDELVGKATKEFLGRGILSSLQPGQELSEGIGHGARPKGSCVISRWRSASRFFADSKSHADLFHRDPAQLLRKAGLMGSSSRDAAASS